jgi:predicted nucleic acid-binding protein
VTTYLLEASSLFLLIRSSREERKLAIVNESRILDLTIFEIGNTLWKESELLKILAIEEVEKLVRTVVRTLAALESISLSRDDFAEVLGIARKEKLTFYDSSYLYIAKKNGLTLVSNDGKLFRAAKKYAETETAESLLRL